MRQGIKAKKTLMALTFLSILLAIPACESSCKKDGGAESNVPTEGEVSDKAAVVNGVGLSKAELDALHKRASEKFAKTGRPLSVDLDRKIRGSILSKMIDDELIRQKAETEGVKVDRFERVEGYEKYKEKMGGQKIFDLFLEKEGLTEEQIQKTVLSELQRDKLINKLSKIEEPTEDEIKKYYTANQRQYTSPEMVHARHILLKLAPNEPKEKADLVLKKANQVLKEASEPSVSFTALVQKYSEGPSAKQGGDLGFFPRGRMVKTFEDAAFGAPLKTPVGPIKTDFGYHIIYVEEKSAEKPAPLEEVRGRVVEFIKRNKRARTGESLLVAYRKSAKIKIYDYSITDNDYKKLPETDKVAEENAKKDKE